MRWAWLAGRARSSQTAAQLIGELLRPCPSAFRASRGGPVAEEGGLRTHKGRGFEKHSGQGPGLAAFDPSRVTNLVVQRPEPSPDWNVAQLEEAKKVTNR